jgi:hypothetical protein
MKKQSLLRWAGAALFAGAAVLSCGTQSPSDGPRSSAGAEHQGTIGLALVPVSGVTLNSVHYVVINGATPAVTIAEGDLPTPGTAKEFSFGLSLPVGTGYTISLSGASAETGDSITCGASYGTFNVAPNNSTSFSLTLTCHDDTNGAVVGAVDTKTDACPKLVFDYVVATPSVTYEGKDIAVLGKAHDLDGKALTYTWKIAHPFVGTFVPVASPTSTLRCNQAGFGESVTVTANNGECSKSLSTLVSCIRSECGNGILEPGEQCDRAILGVPCPPDCTYVCGDGTAEAPVEDCDPSNTANCTAICKTRAPKCNDGWLTNGEICDPSATPSVPPGTPANQVCKADCSGFDTVATSTCNNGIVEPGEQCDGESPTCSNACQKTSTPACVACELEGDCYESVETCKGIGAPFSLAEQTQCYNVLKCIQQSNCFDGTNSLGKCYCGDLKSPSECSPAPFSGPGSPNGPCVDEIKAGFPTFTANTQVLAQLVNTDYPSGAGMKRINCQKVANQGACLDVCGLSAGGPAFP